MKAFFSKIGNWFKNHVPTRRRIIQIYTALLYNANIKGFVSGRIYSNPTNSTKNLCVPGMNCYSCPGAIGACPLGSLQNALEASDTRTPYYVIGILVLFGIILGRTICGFLCPAGLLQELLYKIKTPKLKKNSYTRVFSYTKYIILVALVIVIPIFISSPTFCKYICPVGTFEGGLGLLSNPNNTEDLPQLADIFTWKFSVLVAVIVACIFIYRFFCRFICPLGAIYGFFNKFSLLGIKLEKDKCNECGLCVSHCKMDIRRVGDHECINCGECISVCPTKAISWKGSQIFVHDNQTDIPEAVPSLEAVLNAGTANGKKRGKAEMVAVNLGDTEVVYAPSSVVKQEAVAAPADNETKELTEKQEKKRKPVNLAKRNKVLEIIAWSLAGLLLVFAFVNYNFFVSEKEVIPYEKGETVADFTLEVYDGNGLNGETFTLSESLAEGKVVILNFWEITCNPCIHELPYFNKLKQEYAEQVDVLAIHSVDAPSAAAVQEFINNADVRDEDWKDYDIIFAQDAENIRYNGQVLTAYEAFRGTDAFPVTAIISADGVFTFSWRGSLTYEILEEAFLQAKNS